MQQWKTGEDQLVKIRGRLDPQWYPLLDQVIANKQKMLAARESTPIEAVQQFIKRIWMDSLQAIQKGLDQNNPLTMKRNINLMTQSYKLRALPWHEACKLMTLHPAGGAAVKPAAADEREPAAAPYAHAGDSAFGAVDLTEFPPNEYPDDETPD